MEEKLPDQFAPGNNISEDSHETPTDTNLGRRPSHSFNPNPQNAPGKQISNYFGYECKNNHFADF